MAICYIIVMFHLSVLYCPRGASRASRAGSIVRGGAGSIAGGGTGSVARMSCAGAGGKELEAFLKMMAKPKKYRKKPKGAVIADPTVGRRVSVSLTFILCMCEI